MQPTPSPSLAEAVALANEGRMAEAIPILQRLSASGDAEALFTFADIFWRGAGVVQDCVRARKLFALASDAGQPIAIRATTNLLASGVAGARDWARAVARLEGEARFDGRRAEMLALIRAMALTPEGDPVHVPPPQRLSDRPEVLLFPGAFTAAECDFLVRVAAPTYEPSLIVSEHGSIRDPIRSSDGSTIHWLIEDPATHALNRRLAALSGTRWDQGEPLQILRYSPGQQYHPHVDWLEDPNPRVLTALVYLSDDYEGGETAFVETGLTVRGRKGDALVFRSQAPEGGLDPLSKHAGLPVTRGTKYLASRWIRAGRHAL